MESDVSIRKLLSDYVNATWTASHYGGMNLPTAIYSVLLARLRYKLGPEFHSLFELWNKPESSWPEYIGSYELNEAHKAFSQPEDRYLTKDKIAFAGHCLENDLPTVPIIAAIDRSTLRGSAFSQDDAPTEEWMTAIASAPSRLFLKQIDGGQGVGAFTAKRDRDLWRFGGKTGTAEDLHAFCLKNMLGKRGWIVQPEIRPHPQLAQQLSPRALSTARLVTYMDGLEPKLLFAVLRIPVGDSETDNWSLGLSGNLVAPIDLTSGALGPGRTSRSKHWPIIYATKKHPDTGKDIENYILPYWEETRTLALRAQSTLPQVPTTGWDIAITETGPVILETNSGYGIEIHEVALQRGLRGDLAPTLAYPRIH